MVAQAGKHCRDSVLAREPVKFGVRSMLLPSGDVFDCAESGRPDVTRLQQLPLAVADFFEVPRFAWLRTRHPLRKRSLVQQIDILITVDVEN